MVSGGPREVGRGEMSDWSWFDRRFRRVLSAVHSDSDILAPPQLPFGCQTEPHVCLQLLAGPMGVDF